MCIAGSKQINEFTRSSAQFVAKDKHGTKKMEFEYWLDALPFYMNVQREGVVLSEC